MKNKLCYILPLFLTYLYGCGSTPIPLFNSISAEYKRVSSPSHSLDAILIYRDSGATTSGAYSLFILPKGSMVDETKDTPLLNAIAYKPDISWTNNKELLFNCKKARIGGYSNSWQSKDFEDYTFIVEIRVAPTCRL